MEYTVLQLAKTAGISGRTLRYYDEIGLLKPARVTSSGYRIYALRRSTGCSRYCFTGNWG